MMQYIRGLPSSNMRLFFANLNKTVINTAVFLLVTISVIGQNTDNSKHNNPFAPSPKTKPRSSDPRSRSVEIETAQTAIEKINNEQSDRPASIARETYNIARRASKINSEPTSIYRVGSGDVLIIEIKNASLSSNYYTVRNDGTIDFPLAGENVVVTGQTVDEIEDMLAASIKLYELPQIYVRIRDYVSHSVLVNGLVDVPGYHQLQRDAVPLYVLRAKAGIDPRSNAVKIKRAKDSNIESFLLTNTNVDSVLIFPGDSIEFTGSNDTSTVGYYFIGGGIMNGGKKDLAAGMTLSQAIIASGGVKGKPKRALIRRRSENGMLITSEFEIKNINSGKAVDPKLNQGDIVEIEN